MSSGDGIGGGVSNTSINRYDNETWHHLLVIHSISLRKQILYIDGVKIDEQNIAFASFKNFDYLDIGCSNTPCCGYFSGTKYKGKIDDITIYNRVLTVTEIQNIYLGQPLTAVTTSTATTCGQNNGISNLTVTGGATPYTYAWSNGSTNMSITNLAAGNYVVTITDAYGCQSVVNQLITSSTPFSATIVGTTSFCQGNSTTLTASNGATYRWSNGATTPSVLVNQSGTFAVTVTNSNGCTGSASQTVTAIAPPKADFGFNIQGGKVVFTSLSSDAASYLWQFGNNTISTQANPITNYQANQTYQVCLVVINAQGCRDSICKTINISRVGIQDLPEGLSCSISPNPTRDVVKVNLNFYRSFGTNDKLVLVDVLGKQVFDAQNVGSSNNLNITNLANGIYFVRLTLNNQNYTLGKIVKNE